MQIKTHVSLGTAVTLLALHPTTLSGILCSLTGGVLGGLLPDLLDRNERVDIDIHEAADNPRSFILPILFTGAFLILDYLLGDGMVSYTIGHMNSMTIIGGAVLAVMLLFGIVTRHMHSLFIWAVYVGALYFACLPLAFPFGISYLCYILIDLMNKTPLFLFYPLKKKVSLKLFLSDVKSNRLVTCFSEITIIITLGLLLVSILVKSFNVYEVTSMARQKAWFSCFSWLQLYLIVVNISTLILGFLEQLIGRDTRELTILLDIMCAAGGPLGVLAAHTVLMKFKTKDGALPYVCCIALTMLWFVIYCIICQPFNLAEVLSEYEKSILEVFLAVYLSVMNIIAFIVFYRGKAHPGKKINHHDAVVMLLAIAGGAAGSFAAMGISGNSYQSKIKFPAIFTILLSVQVVSIGYAFMVGIV